MINESRWINDSHGLELTPDINTGKRGNENGILFLAEYYLMKHLKGTLTTKDISRFSNIVKRLEAYDKNEEQIKGLYDRGAEESLIARKEGTQDTLRLVSHDNLTAIAAFSFLFDLPHGKEILSYGLNNFFRWDNAYPEKPRTIYRNSKGRLSTSLQIHPRDLAYWSLCGNGGKLWLFFFPIFFFSQVVSCIPDISKETSGKVLMFLRMEGGSKKSKLIRFTKWVCYGILRHKYGKNWLGKTMKIYFHQKDHPNAVISKDLTI